MSCAAPVSTTPKPNIQPAATSNKKIITSSHVIKHTTEQAVKLNEDIQGSLSSAEAELTKLLHD